MLIYLLRHGLTEYNAEKRYQGQRDIPLSPEGRAQLRQADFDPDGLHHPAAAHQPDGAMLFPEAKLVAVDGLKEMCFGSFEGRNFIEMEQDPDYQAWVKANCESPCPDGETKADFSERICRAFGSTGRQGTCRRRRTAGHPGPRRHPDGRDGALCPAPGGLLRMVRPQRGRLCAGCRRLGRKAAAAPRKDRAVHKGEADV